MDILTRRLQNSPLWGWRASVVLLERFNKEPENPSVKRVVRILELLIEAEHLRVEIHRRVGAHITGEFRYTPADERAVKDRMLTGFLFRDEMTNQLNIQFDRCLRELVERLSRYRWSPGVINYDYWRLEKVFWWNAEGEDACWENGAITEILEAGLPGGYMLTPSKLTRIRRCSDCSAWFAAITDHQRFCSDNCRGHYASQSPEFKEKRAKYMRETYRPREKRKDARARQQAGWASSKKSKKGGK